MIKRVILLLYCRLLWKGNKTECIFEMGIMYYFANKQNRTSLILTLLRSMNNLLEKILGLNALNVKYYVLNKYLDKQIKLYGLK